MSTTTEESQLPFSPFSDSTSVSEPTSDEHPDLGQFNFVFRTLNHLQPHPWIPAFNGIYASSSSASSTARAHPQTIGIPDTATGTLPEGSTVWQQLPILSYLDFSSSHTHTPSELIIGQFRPYGPLEERDYLQLTPTYQDLHVTDTASRDTASPSQSGEEDEDDDTEAGMTVDISSNNGDDFNSSIGDGSPDSHSEVDEEINPDDEYEAEEDDDANGDERRIQAFRNSQIPLMWQSPMRVPLRAYSLDWDSEENADEFGPFDGATTASSGTRPTEGSLYQLPVYHPVVFHRDSTSTPSSVQDGPMSITSLRTSPPTVSVLSITSSTSSLPSFPAQDDNSYSGLSDTYSLLERPASLPIEYRQSNHVFSSPLNDNSTRSSYSASSSPPQIAQLLFQSSSPSLEADINHQYGHGVQPQSSIPHNHHLHHRRLNSGSASTSTITSASTTTRATHAVNDPRQDLTLTSLTLPALAVHTYRPSDLGLLSGRDNNSDSSRGARTVGSASSDISTSSGSTSVLEDSAQPSVSAIDPYESFMDVHSILSYGNTESEDGVGEESLPSLGLLDEALKFIAEERAKWEASRDTGNVSGGLSSDSERWRNELGSDSARESSMTKSSASDLNLMHFSPDSHLTARKKKKIKVVKSSVGTSPAKKAGARRRKLSGAATPVVSILRPDGTVVGGSNINVSRKRRSLESDGFSGSGTLTPRLGGGTWIQDDRVNMTPTKGKDQGLVHSRSVPQLKILTDPIAAAPAEKGREQDVHDAQAQVTGSSVASARGKRKHANVNIANAQTHAVNTKRARLQNLAKQLQGLFPGDKARLDHVLKSLEKQQLWKSQKKEKHKASESSSEERVVFEDEEEDLDPRGRPPRKGDPLVHVFIDHSNILFGLLTHLKRHPPRRPLPPTPSATKPVSSAPASPAGTDFTSIPSASTIIPLPSFATARARIPLETEHETSGGNSALGTQADTVARTKRRVRHLSHAALSLILERGRPVTRRVLVTSSPLYQPMDGMERLGYQVSVFLRVPDLGDGMDRDRGERYRDRHYHRTTLARSHTHSGASKSPCKPLSISSSSGSGSGSGPVLGAASRSGTVTIPKSPKKNRSHTKPRPLSGGTIGDVFHFGRGGGQDGSDVAASAPSSTSAIFHSAMLARAGGGTDSGAAGAGGTPHRIRFREQGVDELLQLKLHQALAAEDDVPEGATIVLATGDGNVGQFNEEGFLGPVRTALKRGWKVELYSWEGGLSRAWKREFGEDSEWGKSGKFRVIGMEPFATSLVEDGWVEV